MERIEESIKINCPADKVFTYTTDAKSWPKWHPVMLEAEQASAGQVGVGTTFKGTNRMMGRKMQWTAKTTEYEPYKKWGKDITAGSIILEEHLIFDTTDTGTNLTIVYDVKVGGSMKPFSRMVIGSQRKETEESLKNLKQILEVEA
ncbi:SRPBCC family protein [Chloroflexota bacterium]